MSSHMHDPDAILKFWVAGACSDAIYTKLSAHEQIQFSDLEAKQWDAEAAGQGRVSVGDAAGNVIGRVG